MGDAESAHIILVVKHVGKHPLGILVVHGMITHDIRDKCCRDGGSLGVSGDYRRSLVQI
jgi:hypothetical protein